MESYLCSRCKQIPFDDIFSGQWTSDIGEIGPEVQIVTEFDSEKEFEYDFSCSFCRAMRSLIPSDKIDHIDNGWGGYQLVAVASLHAYFSRPATVPANDHRPSVKAPENFNDPVWLGVIPRDQARAQVHWAHALQRNGCLAEYQNLQPNRLGLTASPVDPARVDFEIVNEWMQFCSSAHQNHCTVDSTVIPNLRVIDCKTREIVLAPEQCSYVALSYLWGHDQYSPVFNHVSHPAPRTIEDAMLATQKLNFRYLWIDRYCIRQDREDERRHQIKNMHHIYQGAQLTIIAAAGDGPEYGLPGASPQSPRNLAQACVQIGSRLLLSTLPAPRQYILAASWSSRGWTLQEGLLACRRLVFTDQQVYFQCGVMDCCEAIRKPLEFLHHENERRMKDNHPRRHFPLDGIGTNSWEIWYRIRAYTKRQLTHQSDALNAMLGILQRFCEKDWHGGTLDTRHLWGVPMFRKRTTRPGPEWMVSLSNSLFWSLEEPAPRRKGFPSWSWTGWMGVLDKCSRRYSTERIRSPSYYLEQSDGSLISLDGFGDMFQPKPPITQFLHFDADAVKLRIVPRLGSENSPVDSSWKPRVHCPSLARDIPDDDSRVCYWNALIQTRDREFSYQFELTEVTPEGSELFELFKRGSEFDALVFRNDHNGRRRTDLMMVIRQVTAAAAKEVDGDSGAETEGVAESWWERVGFFAADPEHTAELEREVKHIRLG